MIVAVGGIKGGSGKTTVATNLAILCSAAGQDVLLVDSDEQETASDFTILRNEQRDGGAGYTCIKLTGRAVRTEILRQVDKYDHIVIDVGGRDTTSQRAAFSVADVVLVPFVPRSFDVWTLEKVSDLVEEMRSANPDMRAYMFLNRADPRGHDNDEATDVLKDDEVLTFIDTPLGSRKAFSNAASKGLGVTELRPYDVKACDEIMILFRYLFDIKSTSILHQEVS
jgi:chromosome partitioning protein